MLQAIEQAPWVTHHLLKRDDSDCQQILCGVADRRASEQHAAAGAQRQKRGDELAAAVLQPVGLRQGWCLMHDDGDNLGVRIPRRQSATEAMYLEDEGEVVIGV